MRTIKETLHEKRKATEDHIRELQRQGKQGIRYTAMMPDIPFLILGLISDIGWMTHLIAGIIYFCRNGFHHVLDDAACLALAGILFGVVYLIYLNAIHEKEIATKLQKDLGFGMTVYSGLAGGCDWNTSVCAVCRRFVGACVGRDRRLAQLRRRTANVSLLQKRDFLWGAMT